MLVTAPKPDTIAETSFFARRLTELHITVRAVIVHGEVPQALRDNVVALEGKVLTSTALHDAAWATLSAVNDTFRGASLDVYRGQGDEGVIVTLTALDGTPGGRQRGALGVVGDRFVPYAYGLGGSYEGSLAALCDAAVAAPAGVRSWLHAAAVLTGPD